MENEDSYKFFNSPITKGIFVTVTSSLLISIFVLILNMKESIDYIIPRKNEIQDTAISILFKQYNMMDKKIDHKNGITNKRINKSNDNWQLVIKKLNDINQNQKLMNVKINIIFHTVGELKKYQDMVMNEDTMDLKYQLFTNKFDTIKNSY